MSRESGLDLVEIQSNTTPPVVKLMNYGKFLFKREKLHKKKQVTQKIKEIKFRPGTDKNDYALKVRQVCSFLQSGNKVKITVWFRGREILHRDLGIDLMNNICVDVSLYGKYEILPKHEGKTIIAIMIPLPNMKRV